jgi:hypothetical protein
MKWVVGLLVVGLIGYLVYRWTRPSPERKACAKVIDLCGGGKKEIEQCVDGMTRVKKAVGAQGIDHFVECTADSKSCADAMGCGIGSAMKIGVEDILHGVDRAIHQ